MEPRHLALSLARGWGAPTEEAEGGKSADGLRVGSLRLRDGCKPVFSISRL